MLQASQVTVLLLPQVQVTMLQASQVTALLLPQVMQASQVHVMAEQLS